ncbi:MAG: sulfatase [Rhodospirillales bacterium]|nr:sulfatase [Rhodospirillales bacterium]
MVIAVPRLAEAESDRGPKPASKPNFLFILGDDITYSDLPLYGGVNIETPNIDKLAGEGMHFTRAYCASAMCVPFRAELYTGLYPVRNGVAWNHSVAHPGTKSVVHYLREQGYRVGIVGKTHVKPKNSFPFDAVKGKPTDASVLEYMKRDPNQPFALFVCSFHAHPPYKSGDVANVKTPAELPPVLHDNPPTRDSYTRYLAEIVELDNQVGVVMGFLESSGQKDNTLVLFSSEQGWDFAFGKWTNWDVGVRTALIARWPGKVKPGMTADALVQMADIVPTLIAAAGGDPRPHDLDGTSFLPVLLGQSQKHRQYVYGLHNNVPEGEPYPIRSIRDDKFHYIWNLNHEVKYTEKHLMNPAQAKRWDLGWWQGLRDAAEAGDERAKFLYDKYHHRPEEELYLVDKDRWEMTNLAYDAKYAEVKQRLRAEVEKWMKQQGDPGAAMDDSKVLEANREAGGN